MSFLNTVVNELLQIIPRYKFDSLVSEYKGLKIFTVLRYPMLTGIGAIKKIISETVFLRCQLFTC